MWNFIQQRQLASQLAELAPCPLPQRLDLASARRVVVFAPHPDDETLGCGGTLAQLAPQCEVTAVLITDGSGAGGLPAGADVVRQAEFERALRCLGVTQMKLLQQPDGAFHAHPALHAQLHKWLNAYRPDWVFLPSPLDYHRDHVRSAAFLAPLCRSIASVQKLLFYEIWAPIPATHVVDITAQWPLKHQALQQHATAMACGDYVRAIDGLNRYRALYLGQPERWAEAFWVEDTRSQQDIMHFARVQKMGLGLLRRLQALA